MFLRGDEGLAGSFDAEMGFLFGMDLGEGEGLAGSGQGNCVDGAAL